MLAPIGLSMAALVIGTATQAYKSHTVATGHSDCAHRYILSLLDSQSCRMGYWYNMTCVCVSVQHFVSQVKAYEYSMSTATVHQ